jgi:hypothetical protein
MRRKRLQHAADTLCRMFCGWRLTNSYEDLARLGSGTIEIDALSAACRFEGEPIERLAIAGELSAWLREDLAAHVIPESAILRARLEAELRFSEIEAEKRATPDQHLEREGRPIREGRFHRVRIRCKSEVATDEAVYTSSFDDLEEWPVGWLSDREHG